MSLLGSGGGSAAGAALAVVSTANQGYFYAPVVASQVTSAALTAANDIHVFPFVLPMRLSIGKITTEVITTGGAGKLYNVGIYNADGTSLLISTGATDANTAQVNQATPTTVVFEPGPYILAWTSDSNTTQWRSWNISAAQMVPLMNKGATKNVGKAANVSAVAVFPATLGAITASSLNPIAAFLEP